MNSLGELRTFFESVGKKVTDFIGYEFKSDGIVWGVAFENPVADGVEIAPLDWKIYRKALMTAKVKGTSVTFKPLITVFKPEPVVILAPVAKPVEVKKPIIRAQGAAITCPHCGKSGGVIGMKRWHFDKCKDKK